MAIGYKKPYTAALFNGTLLSLEVILNSVTEEKRFCESLLISFF